MTYINLRQSNSINKRKFIVMHTTQEIRKISNKLFNFTSKGSSKRRANSPKLEGKKIMKRKEMIKVT